MPVSTTPGPRDLLDQFGVEIYRRAYDKGLTVSAYLEQQDRSDQYKDGLDAFGRVLKEAGIRTKSVPDHGVAASTWEDLHKNENTRALIHEWSARVWRSAQTGRPVSTRNLYASGDAALNTWERPYSDTPGARWDVDIAPAIPIRSLIAMETPVDGDAIRTFYLTNDAEQTSMTRVAEYSDVPRVRLTGGEHVIRLHKYGRSFEASYETLRRQRLDKIALHIRRMAIQTEIDKLGELVSVLINGDGNSGTAATVHALSALDSAASGSLTLKAWLAFKMKFANPYVITHALAREAHVLAMFMLNMGSANVPLVNISTPAGFGYFTQMNPGLADSTAVGWTDDVAASKILGWDRRLGVEMLTEIGGNIQEVEKFVSRQAEVLVMTEVVGWAIVDGNAARVLNLAG